MIILHTGLPGHGKTINAVRNILAQLAENAANQAKADLGKKHDPIRPIFANIKGLKIDGVSELLPTLEEHPTGSIIYLDEVQQFTIFKAGFSPVKHAKGTEIVGFPLSDVEYIPQHRHKGHDIHAITQNPAQLNNVLKVHVEQHQVTFRPNGGKYQRVFVFDRLIPNPQQMSEAVKSTAVKDNRYKFDKKLFSKYKSTELDTVKKRIPRQLWYFLTGFVVIIALISFAYSRTGDSKLVKSMTGSENSFTETTDGFDQLTQQVKNTTSVPDAATFEETRPAMVIKSSNGTCHARNSYGDFLDVSPSDCLKMATDHRYIPRSRLIHETDEKSET